MTPRGAFTDENQTLADADSHAWFVIKTGRGRFTSYNKKMYS